MKLFRIKINDRTFAVRANNQLEAGFKLKKALRDSMAKLRDVALNMTVQCYIFSGDKVLIQDRIGPAWKGLAVPGGHVKNEESVENACIRETFEETGLKVRDLKLFGTHQYTCEEDGESIALLYKTNLFEGELRGSEEGKVFWMPIKEVLSSEKCAEGFKELLAKAANIEAESKGIEDDRLAPMTYKKLKEFGYTSDDWGDWTQEQANEVVRKHSEGQGEQAESGSEEEVSESEEVVEETGKGKIVSESEGGNNSNRPQENKKQKAPKSYPGSNDKEWLSAFGKEKGNWLTRATSDKKVRGDYSSSVWDDGVPVLKKWDRGQTKRREIEIKKGTPIVVDRYGDAWVQTDFGWLRTSSSGIVNENSSVTISGSNELSPEEAEEVAKEFGLEVTSDENGNKFIGERDRILEMIEGSFGWPESDDIKKGVQEEGAEEYYEEGEEEETDLGYEREEAVKRYEESEEGDIVEFPNGESAVLVRKEGEGAIVKPYPYDGDEYFVHAFDF